MGLDRLLTWISGGFWGDLWQVSVGLFVAGLHRCGWTCSGFGVNGKGFFDIICSFEMYVVYVIFCQ